MLYMDFWKTFQILDKNCLILYFLVTHTEFIIIQNRKKQGQKYAFDSLNLIFTVENNLWKSPLMSFFWGGGAVINLQLHERHHLKCLCQ